MIENGGIITSVAGLLDAIGASGPAWFRGQSQAQWDPAPGVLRPYRRDAQPVLLEDLRRLERIINNRLSLHGRRFQVSPIGEMDVDLYVRAQHGGLPTRLLDWSENPLAAAFFAVETDQPFDGALFQLQVPRMESTRDERDGELIEFIELVLGPDDGWVDPDKVSMLRSENPRQPLCWFMRLVTLRGSR